MLRLLISAFEGGFSGKRPAVSQRSATEISPALRELLVRVESGEITDAEADDYPADVLREAERRKLITGGGGWSVGYRLTDEGRRLLG